MSRLSLLNSLTTRDVLQGFIFTGVYENIIDVAEINFSVQGNQAVPSSGISLTIEFSNDKVNISDTHSFVIDTEYFSHKLPCKYSHFRLILSAETDVINLNLTTIFKSMQMYNPVQSVVVVEAVDVVISDPIVVVNGQTNTTNSSTTPLLNGETFTGAWVGTLEASQIDLSLETDAQCLLQVQFSVDAIITGITKQVTLDAIAVPYLFNYEPLMNYYRVLLTSQGDMTYLRLNATLRNIVPYKPVQDISGSVQVTNFPETQIVSGTVAVTGAYQEIQPVSGTVAVTGAYQEIQPVSGTVAVTGAYQEIQPVSGTVAVTGAYQEIQPVSGSISLLPATDPNSTIGTVRLNDAYGSPLVTTAGNLMIGINNIYTTNALHTIIDSIDSALTFQCQERPTTESSFTTSVGTAGLSITLVPTTLRNFSFNTTSAVIIYIMLYDTGVAPVQADTPKFVFPIMNANNVVFNSFDHRFVNGLGVRAVTSYASGGTGAPVANTVFINMTLSS